MAANSAKLLTKMSIGKFTLLLRAVVQAIVPAEDGHCGLCSYSLRRFLPTVADKLMLPGDLRDPNLIYAPTTGLTKSEAHDRWRFVRCDEERSDAFVARAWFLINPGKSVHPRGIHT